MKDKRNKNRKEFLARKAKKIVDLENEVRMGKDVKSAQHEIENIMSTLSIEDLLEIDEYIVRNKLIK